MTEALCASDKSPKYRSKRASRGRDGSESRTTDPVRAMPVELRDVLVQDRPQLPRPSHEHPAGDLGPGRAHPAFGILVPVAWNTASTRR
jgi:hypothetical protein